MDCIVSRNGVFLLNSEAPMNDLEVFFKELKDCYQKENQDFNFDLKRIGSKSENKTEMKTYVYYIAYNLSKNIMHGPLPKHLHTRMILDCDNLWSKKYIEYLERK